MANGSRRMLDEMGHQEDPFREVIRCALMEIIDDLGTVSTEIATVKGERLKTILAVAAIAIVPIVVIVLDKVL